MSETHETRTCSICETELRGSFCDNCGQKATFRKTGYLDVLQSILLGVFSMERGILGILRGLTVSPRMIVENYWNGYRFYHFSPGQLIFYAIFILGLHLAFVDSKLLGVDITIRNLDAVSRLIFSPQVFLLIFILPLFSLTSYLSFLRQKRSYPEHFVSATYVFSYSAIVCTVTGDLIHAVYKFPWTVILPFFLGIMFVTSARIFNRKRTWYHFIFSLAWQVLIFFLLIAVLTGIMYLADPDNVSLVKSGQ